MKKRLLLMSSLVLFFVPYIVRAQDWKPIENNRHHWKMSANEMATAGFAVAAMLGVAGYLVLRRRRST